jgi:phage regulator Rha-like protein
MQIITHDHVKSKIIQLHNQNVLLDSDVAELYGVEVRAINQAVSRNLRKFPEGYLIELDSDEWKSLKSQIVTSKTRGGKTKLPTAFTERGLYMLATILKSDKAINTTIAIIDTFTQLKEITQAIYEMADAKSDKRKMEIFERSTEVITDLLDNSLIVSQQETSFKLKLPFFEVTRTITKVNNSTSKL